MQFSWYNAGINNENSKIHSKNDCSIHQHLIEMSSDIDGSLTSLPEILMITIIKLFSNDGNLNAIIFS